MNVRNATEEKTGVSKQEKVGDKEKAWFERKCTRWDKDVGRLDGRQEEEK